MERITLTNVGRARLEAELRNLLHVERPAVIAAIDEARGHGDLKENAEYHAAKEKQGFIEGRIAELESKLSRVDEIDPAKLKGSKAMFGATVRVVDDATDKEHTYILVGPDEANLEHGFISTTSPLGKSLLGKSEGDEAVFQAPNGKRTYEVLKVEFKPIPVIK